MNAAHEEPADHQLVERIAGGDRQALAMLYDRYASSLLAAGMRMLRQRRDAEDVLHDVFVEVWQQAADYDRMRGSVKAWLSLRMRSRAIDRMRRLVAKETMLDGAVVEATPAQEGEDFTREPDRRLVVRALSDLPKEQRIALELAYFDGLSGSQIAARLGAPLGTIKTRLALGMGKLRAALDVGGGK
jgi:RNA polymerase sigma-70 factor (ECF subfamily)